MPHHTTNEMFDTTVTEAVALAAQEVREAAIIINRVAGFDGVIDLSSSALEVAYDYLTDVSIRLGRLTETLGAASVTFKERSVTHATLPEHKEV